MAASVNDKLLKAASRWTGTIGSGGVASATTTTIPLSSVSGLPTDTAIILAIDRVDSDSNSTPSSFEVIKGVVSGSNIDCGSDTNRGIEGTAQSHSAGAVVEYLFTASQWDEMIEALLEEHNQDGTHADVALDSSADFTTEHNTDGTHKSATVTTLKASGAEIDTGTEDAKIVTPKAIADSIIQTGWTPARETWTYASADAPTYVITVPSDARLRYSAGMRVKLTHGGSTKYFIITAVAETSLTLYGGTDYALADTAITNPYYSTQKAPLGFPLDPSKWTVQKTSATTTSQNNPVNGTWYNHDSLSFPIGEWNILYELPLFARRITSGQTNLKATLSTANNSESNSDLSSFAGFSDYTESSNSVGGIAWFTKYIPGFSVASKTTYYLNFSTTSNGISLIQVLAAVQITRITLVSAYL